MKKGWRVSRRRGVAGIVASVILFAMLFTVGGAYFMFEANSYQQYVKNLVHASQADQDLALESMTIIVKLTGANHLGFYVNNTGGINVNMTAVIVVDTSGNILKCGGIGLPTSASCSNTTPALSIVDNVGKGQPSSGLIDTGYTYVSGTDTVKVITARGNVFSASYPSPTIQLVSNQINAQVAVSVGSLLINQQSFRFFCSSTCNYGDGYNVQGFDAFAVNAPKTVFSLTVTNEDPNGRGITLNQKSILVTALGSSSVSYYIVNGITDSSPYTAGVTPTAFSQSSPIVISYGATTTLYFGATAAGGTGLVNAPASGVNGVFLMMFGQYSDNSYYSQTIPFEATYSTGGAISNGQVTSGCAGNTYTYSLTASSWSAGPSAFFVANPATGAGTPMTVGTPTTSSVSFKFPSGTAQAYYQIFLDDGINVAYAVFHVNC